MKLFITYTKKVDDFIGSNLENGLSFKLQNHFTINYENSRVMMDFFSITHKNNFREKPLTILQI